MNRPRIVSLLASGTEIVCALGFENALVGRSHECDFPPWVRGLPACTKVKFAADGRSYEIDARVKAIVQEGLSIYLVDSQKLNALSPTHIITQVQCEVCAVSLKDVEKAVYDFVGSKPRIVALNPNYLADVFSDIRRVADSLDAPDAATKLIASMEERMGKIGEEARQIEQSPSVACIEWIDPLMAAGNWVPELVQMAGGVNAFGVAGKHSPTMRWEELVQKDPEVLLIFPCGFNISKSEKEIDLLTSKPEWGGLQAVRSGNVFLLDGNQYFNRSGPRLVESLEILAEIFHPDRFRFGHEGKGWVRFSDHL